MKKILNFIFVFILLLGLLSFFGVKRSEACGVGSNVSGCCWTGSVWDTCTPDQTTNSSRRCTCSGVYSACTTGATPFGPANVKYRSCPQDNAGTTMCGKVGGVFYDIVSCAAGVPTATPIQTIFKCTCTAAQSGCENYLGRTNVKHRVCTGNTTGTSNCEKVGGTYVEFISCGATATNTPIPGTPTPTPDGGGTPTRTPTPPANCSYRWFCVKSTGKCRSTAESYYDTSAGGATINGQCGGGPSCSQNVSDWLGSTSETTCYTKEKSCSDTCKKSCPKLIEGDADCDGNVTLKDYFYYVAKKAGFTVKTEINVDFNSDGKVDNKDRDIVVKTLKP